ncbi:ABC transporter ATP-binding protein [Kineococcus rubinsiae]|uniref:ABC transporter ATP-binding protein n=1 Tax=Kineococcus rubinsiae TaxID=2609562 RepID=UPI0027E45DA9|nr:ABC transporter ATP-binding protein [Kineococcus rubinsiae]
MTAPAPSGVDGPATSGPAIEAVDVTRSYDLGGTVVDALQGVSFVVEEGEYAAIVGPSGSGKSTLMHLLGCLDRPTSGVLRVGGRDVLELDDSELADLRNREVGFVFQSFQLLPRSTALDNVGLPLLYRGTKRAERRELAEASLRAVGLGHRLTHRPNQMSGGEQQRVAIARALVGRPRILLADEPTGNLDTRNGAEVMRILEELNAEQGVAVVLVTHDDEVAGRARRQVRVRDGRVERDTALEARPAGPAGDAPAGAGPAAAGEPGARHVAGQQA